MLVGGAITILKNMKLNGKDNYPIYCGQKQLKPPTRCVLLFVFNLNWRYLVPTWGYSDFFGLDQQGERCLSGDPSTELIALRHHESYMTPPFPPAKTETPIPKKWKLAKIPLT